MAVEGPQIAYGRPEDEPALTRALRLAREVEELLEEASSSASGAPRANGVHSTRIVRAMAASLVDELDLIVREEQKTHVA
ncbi:MAG: hypothetical protein KF850_27770 [Labilithrix sp.]|nr:hypothetical protein [Labilithrix sp.]